MLDSDSFSHWGFLGWSICDIEFDTEFITSN